MNAEGFNCHNSALRNWRLDYNLSAVPAKQSKRIESTPKVPLQSQTIDGKPHCTANPCQKEWTFRRIQRSVTAT